MSFHDPRPGCYGKIAYASPQQAHAALERMAKENLRYRFKKHPRPPVVEVYRCSVCRMHHIGSTEKIQ